MARRVSVTTLNASTLDILNTIRANASYEYQSLVPEITDAKMIPKVGEILLGYPAIANQFLTALINRIALVKVKSVVFNNAYAELKKGYLEFGETVEEVFVSIAKAREFSAEKAEARELKRSLPDVRSAFHTMNWRVQYPITIQDEDLRLAFLSMDGVQDLIARIVDSMYTAQEYDEYLLFKYLMIKAIAKGAMYPVQFNDIQDDAYKFRGISNLITFMSDKYNNAGVHTTTPKADQAIFLDAMFDAQYDVNVLASAFNMDKAEYMGKRYLIDDWGTFDNERWDVIRSYTDMVEEVTDAELAITANVKAVLVDKEWFQMYDNQMRMTEKYVASGEYWNYFLNVWKTVSYSPFSNAIVFVNGNTPNVAPATLVFNVRTNNINADAVGTMIVTFEPVSDMEFKMEFVQTEDMVENGIAMHKYGAMILPNTYAESTITIKVNTPTASYTGTLTIGSNSLTLTKDA